VLKTNGCQVAINLSVCGNFFFKGVFGCRHNKNALEKGDHMPVYEYKCSKCHESFEIKQSFHDKPVTVCHRCGSEARRVFRPAPIIFKGSGFYVTDHAKDKEKKTESRRNGHKETPATSKETPKPDNSISETKTETGTDSSSTGKKEESAS